jgi:uncharacterized protein (TIGR03437 family)
LQAFYKVFTINQLLPRQNRGVTRLLMKHLFLLSMLVGAAVCSAQTPVVLDGGVVNGASFAPGQPVSPGALVSIFGKGLVSKLASSDTIPLSSSLSGVTVTFADLPPAPLLNVIPGAPGADDQINAQVPWNIGSGSGVVNVMVTNANGTSMPVAVKFAPSMPGIFVADLGGQMNAAATILSDGAFPWRLGLVPGSHPAKAGDILVIYATGLGAVDHQPVEGGIPSQTTRTIATPTVLIGGISGKVDFSGLSPQFVGVNQLNVEVPTGVKPGNAVPLQIEVNGVTSTNTVVIAIQ